MQHEAVKKFIHISKLDDWCHAGVEPIGGKLICDLSSLTFAHEKFSFSSFGNCIDRTKIISRLLSIRLSIGIRKNCYTKVTQSSFQVL